VVVDTTREGLAGDASRRDRWFLPAIGLVSLLVLVGVGFILLGRGARAEGEYSLSRLPAVNAFLNGTSAVLLSMGYVCIRRRRVTGHKICMSTAFAVSCLFLISYLIHHYQAGSVPFSGQGWIRPVYFSLLISHVILAALVVPLALTTLYRAVSARFDKHVRIARWTLPIWLYVSVSGVVVYVMLYRLYPPP
jgi:putative membrane protein